MNGAAVRFYKEIMKENASSLNGMMKNNSELIHELSNAKGLNEIFLAQTHWRSKVITEFLQHAKHMQNILLEYTNDYSKSILQANQITEKGAS